MVTAGRRKPGVLTGRLSRSAVLMLLALGSQLGCTREFYREWANQDVSEAVFEKSRDPRWRLDAFSIEPPALSRFADPYDQDFPPAPPDDPAAEALSPVPQWPDNRLIVPVEANGYLTMLERWREERLAAEAQAQPAGKRSRRSRNGRSGRCRPVHLLHHPRHRLRLRQGQASRARRLLAPVRTSSDRVHGTWQSVAIAKRGTGPHLPRPGPEPAPRREILVRIPGQTRQVRRRFW